MSTTKRREQNGLIAAADEERDSAPSSNEPLQEAYEKLEQSERRFRDLYDKAPEP